MKESVVGLVIPTGYSFNLDAFSIYLTLAVVFIAQATNTPLSLGDLLLVLWRLADHVEGAHGVPGSAIVILAATLERGAEHSRHRPRAGAVGRLVHRHGLRTRQPRRQLRSDGGGSRLGSCDPDRTKAAKVLEGGELVDVTAEQATDQSFHWRSGVPYALLQTDRKRGNQRVRHGALIGPGAILEPCPGDQLLIPAMDLGRGPNVLQYPLRASPIGIAP